MVFTVYQRNIIVDSNSQSLIRNSKNSSKNQSSSSSNTISVKTVDWNQLQDVTYFTRGGSSIIQTAFYDGKEVIIKSIDPEYENNEACKSELENELKILSILNHEHILKLCGSGFKQGKRFLVLERLHRSLSDVVESKSFIQKVRIIRKITSAYPLKDGIEYARAIADAVRYCHDSAVPGCMLLHRDLKPGNMGELVIPMHTFLFLIISILGFASDGKLKLFDFGLARMLENASSYSDKKYLMTGKTGSLRYMAPEVVNKQPYNFKVDVYSFGIIFCEILSGKKSFRDFTEERFLSSVVAGNKRPTMNKAWPKKVIELMENCWDADMTRRPTFSKIIQVLDDVLVDLRRKKVISGNTNRLSLILERSSLKKKNSIPGGMMLKSVKSLERPILKWRTKSLNNIYTACQRNG